MKMEEINGGANGWFIAGGAAAGEIDCSLGDVGEAVSGGLVGAGFYY